MSNEALPSYLSMAKPNPPSNRAPWYKNTAPSYAGIFLWFVFWSQAPSGGGAVPGGTLAQGVGTALLGLVVAALICHFLFYLVPGMLGMKTGLPLYVVGSSTYGTQGGFLMPGFLMGVLQFGWLGVNAYFAAVALAPLFGGSLVAQNIIAIVWAVLAGFVGLKGIQYVAKVGTLVPIIPVAILVILLVKTIGGVGSFDAAQFVAAGAPEGAEAAGLSFFGVIALSITFVVGFFATAGAAGVDFGTNSIDGKDVQMGGLVGVALTGIIAAGAALLIAAGAFGNTGTYAMNPTTPVSWAIVMGLTGAGNTMASLLAAAVPVGLFLLVHCGQQLQDDVAEDQSVRLGRSRCPCCDHPGRDRLGRSGWQRFYSDRRFLWSDLWRDDGRLPPLRQEMVRSPSGLEPRRVDLLGGWVCRGNRAAGRPGQHPGCAVGRLYCRCGDLLCAGQGGTPAACG